MKSGGIDPSHVHLVVDLGLVGQDNDYSLIFERLPALDDWRSFAVVAGSFPKDLTGLKRDRKHRLPRLEWEAWKAIVAQRSRRRPVYGDYTTLHPTLSPIDRPVNPSASIRYTAEDDWIVMRGRGVRTRGGPGPKQYWAHAELLRIEDDYRGSHYSFGDQYIWEVARRESGPGNATKWAQVSVNHHLTFVLHQVKGFTTAIDADLQKRRLAEREWIRSPLR